MILVFLAVAKALAIIVMVAGPICAIGAWASFDAPGESPAPLPRAALLRRR